MMSNNNQYDVPLTVVPDQNVAPPAPPPAAAPIATEPKAKRVLTESQLRGLAAGRKKQMEAREAAKKQAQAEKEEVYEEEEEQEEEEGEDEQPLVRVGKPAKAKVSKQALLDGQSESSKAMNAYYELKLKLLQSKVDADAAMERYKQAPSERHMADVAKQELRKKLDSEAMNRAYLQLFGESYSLRA
jgi:hypothetical protein